MVKKNTAEVSPYITVFNLYSCTDWLLFGFQNIRCKLRCSIWLANIF